MHLACYGGHVTVVGLLLSRSAELLHSHDKHGKTGLHIAAQHGHYQMVEVLLGKIYLNFLIFFIVFIIFRRRFTMYHLEKPKTLAKKFTFNINIHIITSFT